MIEYLVPLAIASLPSPGTAELTVGDRTSTHAITDCLLEPANGLPARLLIQDMDVTVNLAHADHMQSISFIRDDVNWSATRMFIAGKWLDAGKPGEPIIQEWGETIRVEATMTIAATGEESEISLVANCAPPESDPSD